MCEKLDLEANAARLTGKEITKLARARRRKESRRGKAVGSGNELPPKNLQEAFKHPTRAEGWKKAALDEFQGLTDIGVFDHGYSWEGLRKAGINPDIKPPIPLSIVLVHKYSKEGASELSGWLRLLVGFDGSCGFCDFCGFCGTSSMMHEECK